MTETKQSKPWFGSKRYGVGLRPQTWQGWAVVAALVLVIILARVLFA